MILITISLVRVAGLSGHTVHFLVFSISIWKVRTEEMSPLLPLAALKT